MIPHEQDIERANMLTDLMADIAVLLGEVQDREMRSRIAISFTILLDAVDQTDNVLDAFHLAEKNFKEMLEVRHP